MDTLEHDGDVNEGLSSYDRAVVRLTRLETTVITKN